MDPLTIAAIGAGTGLLKSELVDRPKEDRQRKYAAEAIRYSPWTKMDPSAAVAAIQPADSFSSAMQGGMTGMQLGQGMEMQDAYKKYLGGQSPYMGMQSQAPQPGQNMSIGKPSTGNVLLGS